jgi:hypothetical protein
LIREAETKNEQYLKTGHSAALSLKRKRKKAKKIPQEILKKIYYEHKRNDYCK